MQYQGHSLQQTLIMGSISSKTSLPAAISTGKVLQVVSTTKTDTYSESLSASARR